MSKEWQYEEVVYLGGSSCGQNVSALEGGCMGQSGSSWWQRPDDEPQGVWLDSVSFTLSGENP